ncbi:diaminopimelate epimerase [Marivita sp. XM-24bin2]|jgi:diaminopimelate epimerase|uniref:diaminopimelate epimerase n=1 Tax=unclassified Marivita TaxID=2632480 RepID=UPI000D7A6ACB|nr:diaminopimelate epimerase [Marivita sp. XM-24bin2]MCR9108222.1 diaminopimelate epimerase [Paracoccaceae bacterium]PWL37129.1 MAG: diaminopimelate epimerase [Marivita sp. XM-24bin2]
MMTQATDHIAFMKMHGLGNDFVVLDTRERPVVMTAALAKAIGDRHRGVGFDQLALIEQGDDGATAHLTFYNSDGSTAGACGNATRCIARHLMDQGQVPEVVLTTERGQLMACDAGNGLTSVNMGHPQLRWDEVPLAREMDTLELPIDGAPTATGMGNPHCTFFVDDADSVDLEARGDEIEHHPLYPQRTNVQFASLVGPDHLRMRVWERGVGVTLASGSSSCATAVAAARRGLTGRSVRIDLDGGRIEIDWRDDGVWMTGPTAHVFSGTFTSDWLEQVS